MFKRTKSGKQTPVCHPGDRDTGAMPATVTSIICFVPPHSPDPIGSRGPGEFSFATLVDAGSNRTFRIDDCLAHFGEADTGAASAHFAMNTLADRCQEVCAWLKRFGPAADARTVHPGNVSETKTSAMACCRRFERFTVGG